MKIVLNPENLVQKHRTRKQEKEKRENLLLKKFLIFTRLVFTVQLRSRSLKSQKKSNSSDLLQLIMDIKMVYLLLVIQNQFSFLFYECVRSKMTLQKHVFAVWPLREALHILYVT